MREPAPAAASAPPDPESWAARACLGSDLVLWYGAAEDGPGSYEESDEQRLWRERRAVQICTTCPVIEQCLTAELTLPLADQHGVCGGMTAGQRRGLLASQRHERPSAEAQVQRWLAQHADGPEAA